MKLRTYPQNIYCMISSHSQRLYNVATLLIPTNDCTVSAKPVYEEEQFPQISPLQFKYRYNGIERD
jgi:hypothetical protein